MDLGIIATDVRIAIENWIKEEPNGNGNGRAEERNTTTISDQNLFLTLFALHSRQQCFLFGEHIDTNTYRRVPHHRFIGICYRYVYCTWFDANSGNKNRNRKICTWMQFQLRNFMDIRFCSILRFCNNYVTRVVYVCVTPVWGIYFSTIYA